MDERLTPVGAGDTFMSAIQKGAIDAGMTTEPTVSGCSRPATPTPDLPRPARPPSG
jgi:hypothetical protein